MHSPAPQNGSAQFWLGFRMFIPVAISIASYGVVWGVLAGQAGLSLAEVALMSGLVFAGASQFVALDMWTPGNLPIVSIVIAVGIINPRMMLMSATLKPLVCAPVLAQGARRHVLRLRRAMGHDHGRGAQGPRHRLLPPRHRRP